MTVPTRTEHIVLLVLTLSYMAFNIHEHGWKGVFMNYTVFGGFVAGWVWCLAFHKK